jgi:hypothetical protein
MDRHAAEWRLAMTPPQRVIQRDAVALSRNDRALEGDRIKLTRFVIARSACDEAIHAARAMDRRAARAARDDGCGGGDAM